MKRDDKIPLETTLQGLCYGSILGISSAHLKPKIDLSNSFNSLIKTRPIFTLLIMSVSGVCWINNVLFHIRNI